MNIHKNARLTVKGRELLISRLERGERPQDVATAMGVSTSTVCKWRKRYRDGGLVGSTQFRLGRSPLRMAVPRLPSSAPLC